MLLINNDSRLHSFAFYQKNGEKVVKTSKLYFLPGKKTEVTAEARELLESHPAFQKKVSAKTLQWLQKEEATEESDEGKLEELPEVLPADYFSTRKRRKRV